MQPEGESVFTRGSQELSPALDESGIAILAMTWQLRGEAEFRGDIDFLVIERVIPAK